jgi:hypothetical protein
MLPPSSRFSETLVTYHITTHLHIPQDHDLNLLQVHRRVLRVRKKTEVKEKKYHLHKRLNISKIPELCEVNQLLTAGGLTAIQRA